MKVSLSSCKRIISLRAIKHLHRSNYHVAVLKAECSDYMQVVSGGIYVDCTVGGGGHTNEILKRGGKVIGLDQDTDALEEASKALSQYKTEGSLELHHANFKDVVPVVQSSSLLAKYSTNGLVDAVLFDLGVSSFQIDNPTRGFAFRLEDCPLDMRMNRTETSMTAAHLINSLDVTALADLLYFYGDEPRSRAIAREIVASRPLSSSSDVVKVISRLVPGKYLTKTLARCFQALRIEVNGEMASLDKALGSVQSIMRLGGRLVVLSYQSHEDRRVKDIFKRVVSLDREDEPTNVIYDGSYFEGKEFTTSALKKKTAVVNCLWKPITKKPIVPSRSEIAKNSRARSAKLRVGERIG